MSTIFGSILVIFSCMRIVKKSKQTWIEEDKQACYNIYCIYSNNQGGMKRYSYTCVPINCVLVPLFMVYVYTKFNNNKLTAFVHKNCSPQRNSEPTV